MNLQRVQELIADRGYPSGAVRERMKVTKGAPIFQRRNKKGGGTWQGKGEQQQVV